MSVSKSIPFRLSNVRLISLVVVLCLVGTYILMGCIPAANAASVGCVPGETRQVNGPAASASVGAFSGSRREDSRVYQPDDGWYLEDWVYVDTNSFGKNGYSVDYVQSESSFATESQLNEAYNSAIDLAGKYGLKSGEAHLRDARTNAVSYARLVQSSHRAVVLTIWAQGRGNFSDKGSSKAGYLLLTLRCVGNSSPSLLEARIVENYLGGNRFYLKNNCDKDIEFSLSYRNLVGEWQTEGVYHFEPNKDAYLNNRDGTPVYLSDPTFYWHAITTDGSLQWSGGYQINGLPMRIKTLALDRDNDYALYPRCD